jgi:type IV pilus assembly protein PilA
MFLGLTLIELVVVIVVVGVLAAIAIPSYQDYTVRAQVTEGLNISDPAKLSVAQAYARSAAWPKSLPANETASLKGKYVDQVYVTRGTIYIEYGGLANARLSGQHLTIRPTINSVGEIVWSCGFHKADGFDPPSGAAAPSDTTVPTKDLPASCRM